MTDRDTSQASNTRPDLETTCRKRTAKGNAAFASANYNLAKDHYAQALATAETLFRRSCAGQILGASNNIALFVVASINLAENWARLRRPDRAVVILQTSMDMILATLKTPGLAQGIKNDCYRHVKNMLSEVIHYMEQNHTDDAAIASYVAGVQRDVGVFIRSLPSTSLYEPPLQEQGSYHAG